MNSKTNIHVKTKAIESITEILEIIPSLAYEAFTLLKVEIINSNANYNVDSITKRITQIIKLKPILEAFTFLKSAIMNANVEKHVKTEAVKSIAEIVKAEPSLTQEAFTFLKSAIMNANIDKYVKAEAVKSIAEIVKAKPSLAQEIFTLSKKVIINSDANYYIKYAAIKSILKVVIEVPSLLTEAFIFLRSVIINSNIELSVKSDAALNIVKIVKVKIVKAKPNLAKKAYIVLRNLLDVEYNKHIIYAAGTSLVELIESIPFDKMYYKYVRELFKIIKLTTNEELNKDLHAKATATLNKITAYITQEYEKGKNHEVIEWFTESFNELPSISETRIFLKEICKSILKSGVINEYESKFILSCIKKYNFTFTVSVNKEPGIEGKIIFEDRNYEIFTTDNSANKIVTLEEFATKLLAETNDPLAENIKRIIRYFRIKDSLLK